MPSPTPKLMAAMAAVINTTELCELILGGLSATDLARFRRVCRRWKEIIDTCPSLRAQQFLIADYTHREVRYVEKDNYPFWQDSEKRYLSVVAGDRAFMRATRPSTIVKLHPLLDRDTIGGGPGLQSGFSFNLSELHKKLHIRTLDTLISQPPITTLALRREDGRKATVKQASGITFRDMFLTLKLRISRQARGGETVIYCRLADATADSTPWVRDAYARLRGQRVKKRKASLRPESLEESWDRRKRLAKLHF